MRVGLSWQLDTERPPADVWRAAMSEVTTADGLGFDSVWLDESRAASGSCPSPSILLTYLARRTSSIQLRAARRLLASDHPVRVAEEMAVLDLFSRGRAGVCFAAGGDGSEAGRLHQHIDFVLTAWGHDEFCYRGSLVRFPSHISGDTPAGASLPAPEHGRYVPQWERGPATPDYLAVTPKPYVPSLPVWVEAAEPETLAWAARAGIAPFFGADLSDDDLVAGAEEYRSLTREAGRPVWGPEVVVEREFDLGSDAIELAGRLRALAKETLATHLVWRRRPEQIGMVDQLFRFAGEVQPLLQT